MLVPVDDPQVAAALARALRHPPPFDDGECFQLGELDVRGARDLAALRYCPRLLRLAIEASEVETLAPLEGMDNLASLAVEFSSVRDVSALATCPALTGLQLRCDLVADVAPLLDTRLRFLELRGNPLDDASVALRPRLEELLTRKGRLPPSLDFPTDEELALTRALQARGLRAVHYHDRDGRSLVAFPGLLHTDRPDADVVAIAPAELRAELARGAPTFASLRARHAG